MDRLQRGLGQTTRTPSAILPLIIGDSKATLEVSSALREAGLLIPAIRYPTVPRNMARLRITLTAAHVNGDVEALSKKLAPLIQH